MDAPQLYVARFLEHPLGLGRFVKDFRHGLSKEWWMNSTEIERFDHFNWALNHEQYHYSTDNIENADWWYCNKDDRRDRAILQKYCKVEFLPISIRLS